MEVTWHADAGVVVFSLWQGQTCRSTFRMPVEDAPALIGALSSALGDALAPALSPDHRAKPRRPRALERLIAAFRKDLRRQRADVLLFPPERQAPGSPAR